MSNLDYLPKSADQWQASKRSLFSSYPSYSQKRPRTILTTNVPEGSGGAGGIVLPLQMVFSGASSVSYTIQISFGTGSQMLPLQVDTGSSDLWVASKSCSTSSCNQANGALYNENSAKPSGHEFNITYIAGSAIGPIFYDKISLGGYVINNQALASATDVQLEPLGSYSGILGLALPANSIIASQIPPSTGNAPDGAVFASNLFSMGPSAPDARFLSVSLERQGSNKVPSMLGIGRHPSAVISDPSVIKYSTVISGINTFDFWRGTVSDISVYVNGARNAIQLGLSIDNSAFPSAVLDTGVPVILATAGIANGIYGALGIGPASDGYYYVPCTTPINMTITINDLVVPLHPLDLTQSNGQSSPTCLGLIQNGDSVLRSSMIADMIFGVPFLRNVYMVMAYIQPFANGTFPTIPIPLASSINSDINPQLGLLPLTNSTVALDEFHTVRVLGQPLSTVPGNGRSASSSGSSHGLSIGLKVFIGLISFFAFLVTIFLARFLYQRRSWKKSYRKASETISDTGVENGRDNDVLLQDLGVNTPPRDQGMDHGLAKDKMLKEILFEKYLQRKDLHSTCTTDSARTKVDFQEEVQKQDEMMMDEFGLVYFGSAPAGRITAVGHERNRNKSTSSAGSLGQRDTLVEDDKRQHTLTSEVFTDSSHHRRSSSVTSQPSEPLLPPVPQSQSQPRPSPRTPRSQLADSYFPIDESSTQQQANDAGEDEDDEIIESMAGIGTRHTRQLSSDEFSVNAMRRLYITGSLVGTGSSTPPVVVRPPRVVRPKRHTPRGPSLNLLDDVENGMSVADVHSPRPLPRGPGHP